MPVVRLLLAYWPVVAAAMWWSLRQAPEEPSGSVAYSRRGVPVEVEEDPKAWWGLLSADEQEVYDTAVLDLADQADLDARYAAQEAADELILRSKINAQYRP